MSIISRIEELRNNSTIKIIITLIFLILPGTLTIYIYNYDLFINIETTKLIILSLIITAPIALINGLIITENDTTKKNEELFSSLLHGSIFSGLILYCILLPSWYYKISFYKFILFFIILCIIMNFFEFISKKKQKSKNE